MSLAAKPTWTSRARVEEFAQMRNAAENLRVLAEWCVTKLHSCIMLVSCSIYYALPDCNFHRELSAT